MIGPILLFAIQLAAPADSVYATERLRVLVAELATKNREVPAALAGFSSAVESEIALLRVDGMKAERVMSVQQLALRVRWTRDGRYVEHAIGMRSESRTLLAYNALKLPSFTVPVLYGNRMDLLLGPIAGAEATPRAPVREPLQEMHPLADARDEIYRFDGGEMSERWTFGGRVVTIGKISVSVRTLPRLKTTVFEGDLFFDVERRQLVALRGVIKEVESQAGLSRRMMNRAIRTVGRIEVIMSEWDGAYWLPFRERIELQVASGVAESEMLVLRISSRFSNVEVGEGPANDATAGTTGLPSAFARHLTAASPDSLGQFSRWSQPLGRSTTSATFEPIRASNDSDELRRRAAGPRFGTQQLRQTVRFNRVEGLFTGAGVILPIRSGGGELVTTLGRAWSERAWRGSVGLWASGGEVRFGIRASKDLESTNDFSYAADNAALLIGPLFTRDDQDYVDRRIGAVHVEASPPGEAPRIQLELARVSDREVKRTLRYGLVHGDSGFRENRPISPGDYTRARVTGSLNPDVLAEYLTPGIGLWGRAEVGWGDIAYSRIEARVGFRRVVLGALAVSARLDAGLMTHTGSVPLQQLFELDGRVQLPGFSYKSAAGDRAVLGMFGVSAPLLSAGSLRTLPRAFRPRLSAQVFGGFAEESSDDVAAAVRTLEFSDPQCVPTDSCLARTTRRASTQLGLRFLDGALFVGGTRRLSESDRWRFAVTATIF